ncbi:putative RNA-directed DNA polymerase [Helianthus annuus]|nr:putative RNA-directed DNA polymerase [Helianthus annuus]
MILTMPYKQVSCGYINGFSERVGGGGEYDDNGGPWSNVQYRNNRKSKGDGVEWSFLVHNLSDQVTRNILWRSFQPFGYVSDAYVARKRDTKGKCFGFVRYVGVVNMKETLASMNTVKMFGLKVTVSLAKYDKDHNKIKYDPELLGRCEWRPKERNQDYLKNDSAYDYGGQPPTTNFVPGGGPVGQPVNHGGRSYAEALKGSTTGTNLGAKVITIKGKGSLYPLHCIGRAVLGIAKEVMSIAKMKKAIEAEGLNEVGLSYVGGVTYILTFRDKVSAESGMEMHSVFFNSIFSMFQLWNGEDFPYSRLVTLCITGVPFIIRDNSLFDNIGGMFGDVVEKSTFSWQEEDNSVASIKIVTSQPSRIEEAVVIKWNKKTIVCWVTESVGQWMPEIDEASILGSQESDSESGSELDEESEDLNDFEEGEIRENLNDEGDRKNDSGDRNNDSPEDASMENVSPMKVQGSVEVHGSSVVNAGGELETLHGNLFGEPHGSGLKEVLEGELDNSINNDNNGTGGPKLDNMEDNNVGPDVSMINDGPTPFVNLGKRNRDDCSPPSIGSTQGPTQKVFYQAGRSNLEPIDLNTPGRANSGSAAVDIESDSPLADPADHVENLEVGVGSGSDPPDPQRVIDDEVQETIKVGALIGVNLNDFVHEAEKLVAEEGETKLQDSESFMFHKFWGKAEYKIAVVNSQGRSGGLACLWCPSIFRCVDVIQSRFFIVVSGFLVQSGCRVNYMNVYAPNEVVSRRALWAEILGVRNSVEGLWVMMGDFNEVRYASERMNSEFIEANADAFNQFILSAGLVEFNMGGGSFTYISENGKKLSKLDRFLVCLGFREQWPNATVLALDRVASDHRPIVLSTVQSDFGHIPFRFFNSWFEYSGFLEFVLQQCRLFSFSGPADLAFAIKLRWLKNKIKAWMKVEKVNKEGIYGEKKKRLANIENMAEERLLLEGELAERAECRSYMAEFDRIKQLDLKQKSRTKWALEGDENSAYFHHIINSNISTNRMNGLMIDGVWVTCPLSIKESLFSFFANQFTEPMTVRPELVCPNLRSISELEATMLVNPFSLEEIKEAVWDCDGDRAPGPDGFNFKFIKRCWSVIREDLVRLFNKFYEDGTINQCCTSSFIALIPKIKDPVAPADFRPISLIGVINKVISKVLVNRLKGVIGNLISEQQSAFLAGRNIMDGPLILNEVFSWLKKSRRSGMFFKVDISKAYDSVSWAFLNSIMAQMNFPSRWRAWVMATLHSARASVLVNGSPTREFVCSRGLRQGDPLSPFLFVIVMEALTGIMKKVVSLGLFNGIKITNDGPLLSHLIYADDVMFLGDWSISNVKNLRRLLRCFYLSSGLKVNLAKYSIYGVGVMEGEVLDIAQLLCCKQGSFPFKHLGLVVGANMNLARNWKSVIEVFKNRLSIWKAKTLSYGGRITLIKSVMNALPTYYFSLFKAPNKVLVALDKIRRVFFWSGSEEKAKMNWVAWDRTIAPVDFGGLGFGSLKDANLVMLAKWWWRFKSEKIACDEG